MATIVNNINEECYFYLKQYLWQDCKITPLENQPGKITGISLFHTGLQFKVRYFIDGQYKEDWFYSFDIEITDVGQVFMNRLGVS